MQENIPEVGWSDSDLTSIFHQYKSVSARQLDPDLYQGKQNKTIVFTGFTYAAK